MAPSICTELQLSNPYRFRKIVLDGWTDRLTQNGDCIVALRQLKIRIECERTMFSVFNKSMYLDNFFNRIRHEAMANNFFVVPKT